MVTVVNPSLGNQNMLATPTVRRMTNLGTSPFFIYFLEEAATVIQIGLNVIKLKRIMFCCGSEKTSKTMHFHSHGARQASWLRLRGTKKKI
jgi:hypothetical protein